MSMTLPSPDTLTCAWAEAWVKEQQKHSWTAQQAAGVRHRHHQDGLAAISKDLDLCGLPWGKDAVRGTTGATARGACRCSAAARSGRSRPQLSRT